MRTRFRGRRAASIVAALAAVLLVACGGGGGGDGDDVVPFSFVGPYQFLQLDRSIGGMGIMSSCGEVILDGSGSFTSPRTIGVQEGILSIGVGVLPESYALGPDRSLVWPSDLVGRVSPDGSFAAATRRGGGTDPSWIILVRKTQAATVAEMAGEWVLVELSRPFGAGGVARAAVADVTLDASGTLAYDAYHYNEEKAVDPAPLVLQSLTLVLNIDGWLRFDTPGPTTAYLGAASVDRNVILMTAVEIYARRAAALILVRKGQATQTSALTGSFEVAGFENVGNVYGSLWGQANLDGSGSGMWTRNSNTDGALAGTPSLGVTYQVLGDGEATFTDPALSSWRGAVGANGYWALFGGGFTNGSDPRLFAIVR